LCCTVHLVYNADSDRVDGIIMSESYRAVADLAVTLK